MRTPQLELERLVEEHQADCWAYLRWLGGTPAEADDLVQEAFLVLLRDPERVGAEDAGGFLRRTARNLLSSSRRQSRRREEILEADAAEAIWRRRVGESGFDGYLAALRSCLEGLEPRARQVVQLRYREAKSGQEIAGELGESLSNVNSILHRARARLQVCIERRTES